MAIPKRMQLGLDIDGVIAADPDRFAELTHRLLSSGSVVSVVTIRSAQSRRQTERELESYGVSYSSLFFLPEISQAQKLCPHGGLNWYERFLWQKVGYALDQGLSHFVDDDPAVGRLFKKFAPTIEFHGYPESLAFFTLAAQASVE